MAYVTRKQRKALKQAGLKYHFLRYDGGDLGPVQEMHIYDFRYPQYRATVEEVSALLGVAVMVRDDRRDHTGWWFPK